MHQEQKRPVGHPRETRPEPPVEALLLVLGADRLLDLLPLHAERRIGQHVVELLMRMAIIRQGVAENDVADVLPLDQHVRLADGVGLRVQLLPVHDEGCLVVVLRKVLVGCREHPACACRGVVDRPYHTGFREDLVVFHEEEIDHEADDLAGGEVLTGRLVGEFGEPADEFLEDEAHLMVVHLAGVEVDPGELLSDLIQQPRLRQLVQLNGELESLEDVPHVRREALDVGIEVLADVVLVAHELAHVEGRDVVEGLASLAEHERLRVEPLGRLGRMFRQDGILRRLQHTIEPPQDGEGEDDLAVVGLLVVASKEVCDRPDEGRKGLMIQG